MAKHLDEIRGIEVPVYAKNAYYKDNPYFDSNKYAKPKTTKSNSYKPKRTTKNSQVGSGEYAVNKGDSLWKIAQAHGTTVEALRKANPEIKGNMIYPGQIISLGGTNEAKPTIANNTTSNTNKTKQTTVTNTTKVTTPTNTTPTNTTVTTTPTINNSKLSNSNIRTNPVEYQPVSPFTQPEETDYNEPITLRRTLKPVKVIAKRSLSNTKGKTTKSAENNRSKFFSLLSPNAPTMAETHITQMKENYRKNKQKEKQILKQAQERQNRDFEVVRQLFK